MVLHRREMQLDDAMPLQYQQSPSAIPLTPTSTLHLSLDNPRFRNHIGSGPHAGDGPPNIPYLSYPSARASHWSPAAGASWPHSQGPEPGPGNRPERPAPCKGPRLSTTATRCFQFLLARQDAVLCLRSKSTILFLAHHGAHMDFMRLIV
ncbi:hypothetical protein BDP55DRAFT_626448 [Colletotrichum godetiae]|uniref:Uncharacterized protein n=1 Tax=Colletotrichum godetiae TaxID=1209918 RepID=A0AAJ0F3T0_9PEZI|nr:uncharacterized protein BDP55DRAFT_626448 [Colletotrichum godetiae]KAK1699751.1 hypothetical protein BDP55DRAFT_626448 [Colletotrichum godetiae]